MVQRVGAGWAVLVAAVLVGCRGAADGELGAAEGSGEVVGVTIAVDFGPLPWDARQVAVAVPEGADVVAATRAAVPVVQRWLCCDERDVWAVAGVGPDPRWDRYWMWLLDGEMGPNTAAEHHVKDGDRITWRLSKGVGEREVGALGRDMGLVLLDEGARLALWHIGAERRARVERDAGESDQAFVARAIDAKVQWAIASDQPAPEVVAALAAAGIPLDVLDLHNGDLETRLVAWEQLGERLDRLGAARIAARLDWPLAPIPAADPSQR